MIIVRNIEFIGEVLLNFSVVEYFFAVRYFVMKIVLMPTAANKTWGLGERFKVSIVNQ